jgi:hypothetical protein
MPRGGRRFIIAIDVTMRHLYEVRVPRRAIVKPDQWNELVDDGQQLEAESVDTKIAFIEEVLPGGKRCSVSRHETVIPAPRKKRGAPP